MTNRKMSFLEQGDAARDARDWRAAADAYRQAVRENPALGHVWVQLGHAEKESGFLSAAVNSYRKAVSLMPADADAHYQLAVAFLHQGKHMAAAKSAEKALSLDDNLEPAKVLTKDLFRVIADHSPSTTDVEGAAELIDTARFFELVRSLVDHGSEGYRIFGEKPFQARAD